MTNFLEKYGPRIGFVLGGVAAVPLTLVMDVGSVIVPILASSMTFGIVLAGFSATQRNMLFTMRNSQVIRRLKQIDHIETVLTYLSRTSYVGAFIVLFSFAGFFVTEHQIAVQAWIVVVAATIVSSIAYLVRNECVMAAVLKRFMEE